MGVGRELPAGGVISAAVSVKRLRQECRASALIKPCGVHSSNAFALSAMAAATPRFAGLGASRSPKPSTQGRMHRAWARGTEHRLDRGHLTTAPAQTRTLLSALLERYEPMITQVSIVDIWSRAASRNCCGADEHLTPQQMVGYRDGRLLEVSGETDQAGYRSSPAGVGRRYADQSGRWSPEASARNFSPTSVVLRQFEGDHCCTSFGSHPSDQGGVSVCANYGYAPGGDPSGNRNHGCQRE